MKITGKLYNVGICVAIAVVGVASVVLVEMFRPPSSEATTATERLTNVAIQVAEETTARDVLMLVGTLQPWQEVLLGSESQGLIEWLGVDEGDTVSEGEELLRIDTNAQRVRLNRSRAEYELASHELERIKEMRNQGISTPRDLDRAFVDRDVALASLRVAEIDLEASVVHAPFSGLVDTLYQEQDEYVSRGTRLLSLFQVDRVKMIIGIPDRDFPFFSEGDAVQVSVDAYPGQVFDGTIGHIANRAEMATHTFSTEIELANAQGLLRPGMVARAALVREEYPNAIMVPVFSVQAAQDIRYVFVEHDGIARLRPIVPGFYQGTKLLVEKGLSAGENLIVAGHRDLRDGDHVHVLEVR